MKQVYFLFYFKAFFCSVSTVNYWYYFSAELNKKARGSAVPFCVVDLVYRSF